MRILLCNLLLYFAIRLPGQADSSSGYFISFDKTRIYFETHGKGKPILLIHGFTSNAETWKKTNLYAELIKNGYKVVLADLRGSGRSDKPHEAKAYAFDAEAKDLIALMKYLKFKLYDALGYSRGSIILSRMMVLDDHINKSILGGMGADFTNPDWPRRDLFYHVLAGDTIVADLKPMLDRIKESNLDRMALCNQQKEQPSTSRVELSQVKIPVLVISGDEDKDNGSSLELSKMLRYSTYKTVPGKHSGTQFSVPFAKEVIEFLRANNLPKA